MVIRNVICNDGTVFNRLSCMPYPSSKEFFTFKRLDPVQVFYAPTDAVVGERVRSIKFRGVNYLATENGWEVLPQTKIIKRTYDNELVEEISGVPEEVYVDFTNINIRDTI